MFSKYWILKFVFEFYITPLDSFHCLNSVWIDEIQWNGAEHSGIEYNNLPLFGFEK
jgi:hypothetical protein